MIKELREGRIHFLVKQLSKEFIISSQLECSFSSLFIMIILSFLLKTTFSFFLLKFGFSFSNLTFPDWDHVSVLKRNLHCFYHWRTEKEFVHLNSNILAFLVFFIFNVEILLLSNWIDDQSTKIKNLGIRNIFCVFSSSMRVIVMKQYIYFWSFNWRILWMNIK